MAKGKSGGKRATGGASVNATIGGASGGLLGGQGQDDNKQPVQQQQPVTPSMSASFNQFMSMSDDDKADVISDMIKKDVPAHLANNDFQKFIYNIGLNDKPDVVDDATLDSMSGTEFFRTVNYVKNTQAGVTYTAPQIAKQIQGGRITRVSDSGGSAHGRGLYFTTDCDHSMKHYGDVYNNINQTCTVRAKLNSNAKLISTSKASAGVSAEIASGSKLGKILAKCDYDSRTSLYAIAKGYNVIDARQYRGYYNVLNRQAITMSKDIKAKNNTRSWK